LDAGTKVRARCVATENTEVTETDSTERPNTNNEPLKPEEQDPRRWRANGWTAQVIKNDSDDGWAVAMYVDGQDEPALVGPWTMGRDKKNPKPLDQSAFNTLVKTASEVLSRHAQQRRAMLHKECSVEDADGRWVLVELDIAADEDDPHAMLSASAGGDVLSKVRVPANFKLTVKSAEKWVKSEFASPTRE
jgi:hypothetical protein